jgi:hypothetical protein
MLLAGAHLERVRLRGAALEFSDDPISEPLVEIVVP